ncbi:class I SAM-dependent methyltransferase [Streptomyces sp. NPDC092296]|uniref:class I SAM-dependent methyltransferase n=1 Tax=Streptomyces sp. NPDC092296 TaxID=3366012 RepID=UPI003813A193
MPHTFEELITEAAAVSVDGWDFSWLDGRATEERPSWGYARLAGERMARATAALDVQTGGGEVLAGLPRLAPLTAATECWPPNVAAATARLHPRGALVVATADEQALPFGAAAFDLVLSRHPVTTCWPEIARVLRPGGTYFSQQIGPATNRELTEYFLGPQPPSTARDPERARAAAEAAGLSVVDLRSESLRAVFHDVGAVVYFLRKVIWTVPDFTVDRYRTELRALHDRIQADGPFVAHATRFLIEARKRP